MRLLTFTTLYPNPVRPTHGVFVENRLRHLVESGNGVSARVVAPVPWFPSAHPRFGAYAGFARVPRRDHRSGLAIDHPRYPVLPKVGMGLAPRLMDAALRPFLKRFLAAGERVDLIDAHYFYPDGVAAVRLGRCLGLPVVITARGTDLNLIARYAWPRRQIRWAAARADGLITVSAALKAVLVGLGVPEKKIRVLRNGVDLTRFRPLDRAALRAALGLHRPTLLSVGQLIERKGHDLVLRSLTELDAFELIVAGEGPDRAALLDLARRLGVADRVRLIGPVPHEELPRLYGAADALVLASGREGWPNVLLEAMACGTPAVATAVGGVPEIVTAPEAGVLVRERSPAGLAAGVRTLLLERPPDRAATRRYAEGFGWDATTVGQIELFEEILARRRRRRG